MTEETAEWRDAAPRVRARFSMNSQSARTQRIGWQPDLATPYVNTIPVTSSRRFRVIWRRGAAGVADALECAGDGGARQPGLWRARRPYRQLRQRGRPVRGGLQPFLPCGEGTAQHRGDLVFFQPHSAPGVYARAFLEGRLNEADLAHYRQEITAAAGRARPVQLPAPLADAGLLAVPHRLDGHRPDQLDLPRAFHALPDAPAVAHCAGRKVWGVFGDGEMDEPES
jgi:pyruvate dehydrogenase E1 component